VGFSVCRLKGNTTAAGSKLYPITVSKATQVFALPADSAPLLVLFDKGGHVLKSLNSEEKKEWLYQLKNATDLADRADAVIALGKIKKDEEVVAALVTRCAKDKPGAFAPPLQTRSASSVVPTLQAAARGRRLERQPWVRSRVVPALGNFKTTRPCRKAQLHCQETVRIALGLPPC